MTVKLPDPQPLPASFDSVRGDVDAVVDAMRPGRYAFADVYRAYCDHAESAGHPELSRLAFGRALARDPRVLSSRTEKTRYIQLSAAEVARRTGAAR